MTLYKDKYRVESTRLRFWDYSADGWYFLTICCDKHICLFGEIIDFKMNLNSYGKIVKEEWDKSNQIRKEMVFDSFIIMPNHLHAIIAIQKNAKNKNDEKSRNEYDGINDKPIVETHSCASLPKQQIKTGVAYRPPKSVSSFVAGFKSIVTKRINEKRNSHKAPVWQARFYDHVIRDENDLNRIRIYIQNNPSKWEHDKFYN